ncbi:GAF and ANTAR domain-containing protein [Nocardia transvalensis]|uniref:GAF and ANTAR domain-containing protein n=1 Tax=Nocardia transvalensis TaxID=37333 RepID=UPI0018948C41|nr:GAF and ANTAR domain-containing protein [Nocardia transvalensis]MBF6328160.1 GAF and ANTAR domain-containing protein [Nocardia transvalensis]
MGPAPDDEHPLLAALAAAVELLTRDVDVVELSQQLVDACPGVTGGADAGLFLADHRRDLQLLASTSEEPDLLELLQVEALDGPGRHTYRTGLPTTVPDLRATNHRWPEFCQRALDFGYRSAMALPLRCRDRSIGALTILAAAPDALDGADLRAGQLLADLAGIGIIQQIMLPHLEALPARLPVALHARIVIEQAKGVLAERGGLDMAEAFRRLRMHAQKTGRHLAELAAAVVDGTADTDQILA